MALSSLAAQVRGLPPSLNSDAQAALDAALGRSTPARLLLPGGLRMMSVKREWEGLMFAREGCDHLRKKESRKEARKPELIWNCMKTGNMGLIRRWT